MANAINVGTPAALARGTSEADYYDLFARFRISDTLEIRGAVVNLLDKEPPAYTGQSATDPSVFDLIGRRYSVTLSARF
jgi:outer membrane receptor protein involved in Fe transport